MLLASLCFAFTVSFAKLLSAHMSSIEVVFFRNVFGIVLIVFSFLKLPCKKSVNKKPFLLIFRGMVGFFGLILYFYLIANVSLAEAVTYSKASPIFTAILAFFLLKERLNTYAWVAVFVGFIGIVLIMQPDMGVSKYNLMGLALGIFAAFAYNAVRELKRSYDTRIIVLSFVLIGTIGPVILMGISEFYYTQGLDFMLGRFVMPTGVMWLYAIGLGISATLAQIFMTKAYGEAKAGLVGVISYTTIPISIVMGIILGDSIPSISVWIGIFMVVSSGVVIATKGK
ncbi:MAG: FIG00852003: hypothetical protein [uncultured Campylobacterales bacterium]|uniref:EamA domain-containing protein n=1 Tax=uncultured Campylobacterales bacterium TaxID=352960 RepID=A0A6S6SB80_9BACT|nr:MAG: FIG00852003: hypothetical protein [uncultured Campylobacterales bacterium]